MMQGDSYNMAFLLLNNADQPITPGDVQDVEITVGGMIRTYQHDELSYADGYWMFPLSQEESFFLRAGPIRAQARVKWANGFVEGQEIPGIRINESESREVL